MQSAKKGKLYTITNGRFWIKRGEKGFYVSRDMGERMLFRYRCNASLVAQDFPGFYVREVEHG